MTDETTQESEKKKSAKDKSKNQLILAMDADRLGLTIGALVATIVMALSFLQEAEGLAVAFRTGIAFVGAYASTFFFIRVILRLTLYELVIGEKDKQRTKLGRGTSRAAKDEELPTEMDMPDEEVEEQTEELDERESL